MAKKIKVSTNHSKYDSKNRLYRWVNNRYQKVIFDYCMACGGKSLIEVGCGEGYLLDFFNQFDHPFDLTGIELSENAVQMARFKLEDRATIQVGSIFDLDFEDNSFDIVVCSQVLEHLNDPEKALNELIRIAKRYLVISVPREPYFNWISVFNEKTGIGVKVDHVNFWSPKAFKMLLAAHLRVIKHRVSSVYQVALCEIG